LLQYFSVEFEAGNYLQFTTHMSGNEHGHFDPNTGSFTAPVTGRYSFGLSINTGISSTGYYYSVRLRVNGGTQHAMYAAGDRSSYKSDGRFFTTELDLNQGAYVRYVITHSSTNNLKYGGKPDGTYGRQTFFEGKLVRRSSSLWQG